MNQQLCDNIMRHTSTGYEQAQCFGADAGLASWQAPWQQRCGSGGSSGGNSRLLHLAHSLAEQLPATALLLGVPHGTRRSLAHDSSAAGSAEHRGSELIALSVLLRELPCLLVIQARKERLG